MGSDAKWFKIASMITDNLPEVPALECPHCCHPTIDFQYVGERTTNIGFLSIWCPSCLHGKHISRVKIPQHAQIIPKGSIEEIKKRIPNLVV